MKFKLVDCKVTGSIKNASKVDLDVNGFIEAVDEPPINTGWPNEPAGMTVISDYALTDPIPQVDGPIGASGWNIVNAHPPGYIFPPNDPIGPPWAGTPAGWIEQIADEHSPCTPPSVYQLVYPPGMEMGIAPATIWIPMPGVNEAYWGWWWKCSKPFFYGSNGTKLLFLFTNANGQAFISMGVDRHLYMWPELNPPVGNPPGAGKHGDTIIEQDKWYQLEWYWNVKTGLSRLWLNGVLEVEADYFTNPTPLVEAKLSSTYGGFGGPPMEGTNYYWYDHLRLCVK